MSLDNYSLKPVPMDKRKGWAALTFVMLGLTFFSASMLAGGTLGAGLTYDDFWFAIVLGNLMLGIYTSILGYIGSQTGLTTHVLARFSFGEKGSWLPSLILGGTQIGWFGVGVAMFAYPVNLATGIDVNTLVLVSGALMTITVYFGISALTILSIVAVPAIALLGSYSVYLAVSGAGGLSQLQILVPAAPIDFNQAITIVVASFISAGTLTADFVRFGKKPAQAVLICMIAFFIGNSLMFVFGGAGAAVLGKGDISDVMLAQGLILPAIIVLGLNIWTTNDNALYASGLGMANITGLSSRWLSMVNGAIGTLAALWLYNNFVGWLNFLSTSIPPVGGVLIADYFLRHKLYQCDYSRIQFKVINWVAIAAVAIGIVAGKFLSGIVPVNAVLGGAVSYVVLMLVTKQAQVNTQTESIQS